MSAVENNNKNMVTSSAVYDEIRKLKPYNGSYNGTVEKKGSENNYILATDLPPSFIAYYNITVSIPSILMIKYIETYTISVSYNRIQIEFSDTMNYSGYIGNADLEFTLKN